jgi:hypothetical protein
MGRAASFTFFPLTMRFTQLTTPTRAVVAIQKSMICRTGTVSDAHPGKRSFVKSLFNVIHFP